MQVTTSSESIVMNDVTSEQYADWAWRACTSYPFAPLDGCLDPQHQESLHAVFRDAVIAASQHWRRDKAIVSQYTMLWAKSIK